MAPTSTPPRRCSAGGAAAGCVAAAGGGFALGARPSSDATAAPADETVPVPRRAPGRHRDARAGPAALRRLRRRRRAPRATTCATCCARGRAAAARMTAGPARRATPTTTRWRRPTTPARPSACRAARLTITFGFGPSLFEQDGRTASASPRGARPRCATCRRCPATSSTRRAAAATSACRRAPTTRRSPSTPCATSRASAAAPSAMRWSQLGFGRTSSTSRAQATPRNLMGFKDGTQQHHGRGRDALAKHVWVGARRAAAAGCAGGTYLVARRIRMLIEVWDRTTLGDQEQTIGRAQGSAARRSAATTSSTRSTSHARTRAASRCPIDAHVRLAAPAEQRRHAHPAPRLLLHRRHRRPRSASSTPGLFFLAFQRDPRRSSSASSGGSAQTDALNEYIKHVGSGVWAVPPGAPGGGWVGLTRSLRSAADDVGDEPAPERRAIRRRPGGRPRRRRGRRRGRGRRGPAHGRPRAASAGRARRWCQPRWLQRAGRTHPARSGGGSSAARSAGRRPAGGRPRPACAPCARARAQQGHQVARLDGRRAGAGMAVGRAVHVPRRTP